MRLKTSNVSHKSEALVCKILNKMSGLNKSRKLFFSSTLVLFLSMRGRHNFLGMERYGDYSEKTYRLHFEDEFDFMGFNIELCQSHLSANLLLGFDPSFLPKSGKKTPHKGEFWSGCASRALQGIELGCIGVIDLDNNTAFNLESIQTPNPKDLKKDGQTLVDHYAEMLIARADDLVKISTYLAVDGYFAKQKFVDLLTEHTDLELICKLRKDANLRYLYQGPKTRRQGRPKKYDGKVDTKNIDKTKFQEVIKTKDEIVYEAIVWSVSLKRKIKVSYIEFLDEGKPTKRYTILFSTDLELDGLTIYKYYKARFQIEFLFRDAKQFTGLTHCQARSEDKLYFHTNLALTAVGVAKVAHYFDQDDPKSGYSISDIKTLYFNELMLNMFFVNFDIDPNLQLNNPAVERMLNFGTIAA